MIALAVLAASCGGGGGEEAENQPGAASPSPQTATVAVEQSPYGQVLVDGGGRALYLFKKDTEGNSTCYGKCAQVWPPLTTQKQPRAMGEAKAKLLGTISRKNGATQVACAGHPLYYYAPDQGSGAFKGQDITDFGAEWYLLTPAGRTAHGEGGQGGY